MGLRLFDQYSLLHFASGIIAYFWSISLLLTLLLNIVFEFIENTPTGIYLINTYLIGWWPGGKTYPDSLLNSVSDMAFTCLGWIIAWKLNEIYN